MIEISLVHFVKNMKNINKTKVKLVLHFNTSKKLTS